MKKFSVLSLQRGGHIRDNLSVLSLSRSPDMPPPPDLHVVNRPIFAIKSRTYDGIRNPMKGLLAHTSARSFHIRRLNDIMHLCLQRGDFVRAKTAFATLARCNDIDAMDLWHVGMAVADAGNTNPGLQRIVDATVGPARIAFLKEIIVSTKYYVRQKISISWFVRL